MLRLVRNPKRTRAVSSGKTRVGRTRSQEKNSFVAVAVLLVESCESAGTVGSLLVLAMVS